MTSPMFQPIIVAASANPADVIDAAADNIERFPELHNQHTWRNQCGTGGCLAGWMVEAHPDAHWAYPSSKTVTFVVEAPGMVPTWAETWAANLLGLPVTDADDQEDDGVVGSWELFGADLNRPTVVARARAYATHLRDGKPPVVAARLAGQIYIDD